VSSGVAVDMVNLIGMKERILVGLFVFLKIINERIKGIVIVKSWNAYNTIIRPCSFT
jgi:hypothetical protein